MDALLREVKTLGISCAIADRIRQRIFAESGERSDTYAVAWAGTWALSESYAAARRANRAQYGARLRA